MASSRGSAEVRRFMTSLPAALEAKLLPGAARAAANVVAAEARDRSISSEVASAVKVSRAKVEDGRVTVRVQVKGAGAYIAPWLEYGTDPHFITVDESQRRGMSARRINAQEKDGSVIVGGARRVNVGDTGSIVINGQFVGDTVHHPGARPHPFLRPALDAKEAEAIAAAQSFINARVSRAGIIGEAPSEGVE